MTMSNDLSELRMENQIIDLEAKTRAAVADLRLMIESLHGLIKNLDARIRLINERLDAERKKP